MSVLAMFNPSTRAEVFSTDAERRIERGGERDEPHELPNETEDERPGPIDDISTLKPYQMHPVLFPQVPPCNSCSQPA